MKFVKNLPHPMILTATCLMAAGILWGTLSTPGNTGAALPLDDKTVHALAFALLILPLAWSNPGRALRFAPLALAFGAIIELVQPLVGREAEWGDLLADGLGLCFGLVIAWGAGRLKMPS